MEFEKILLENDIDPDEYLKTVQKKAKSYGYPPVEFCDDGKHKLQMKVDRKLIKFGSALNYDYIIYQIKERAKEISKGTASDKRRLYRARAEKIRGDWRDDPYSKNNLAMRILW